MVGSYIDPSAAHIRIADLGPNWLSAQVQLKPSSFAVVDAAWRVHVLPIWGRRSLEDIGFSDVQSWVAELSSRRSATVVRRAHGVLAGILDVAVRDFRIRTNPARGVNLPRKPLRERRYLTHEQVRILANESGGHGLLVLVLAYTGLRWGEAIALRVRHVDATHGRILVALNAVNVRGRIIPGTPKSHGVRSVPVPASLQSSLLNACAGKGSDQLVFGTGDKYLPTPTQRNGWFAGARRRAQASDPSFPANLTPHDLRHTTASLAVSAGANVKVVQRMLGHASAAMTLDVYADLFDEDLDSVALRLDERARRAEADVPGTRGGDSFVGTAGVMT